MASTRKDFEREMRESRRCAAAALQYTRFAYRKDTDPKDKQVWIQRAGRAVIDSKYYAAQADIHFFN